MTNEIDENEQLKNDINKHNSNSKIDLSFRQLTDRDIPIVVQYAIVEKACTVLLLNDNLITSEGAEVLSKALYENKTLKELNLWNNNLSDSGVHSISLALSSKENTIQSLALGQNKITDVGAQHLADMLKTNETLIRLWLFRNEISDQGIEHLTDALANFNKHLQWLDLRLNRLITDASGNAVINMLKSNITLTKFWMEYCGLSPPIKQNIRNIGHTKNNFEIGA